MYRLAHMVRSEPHILVQQLLNQKRTQFGVDDLAKLALDDFRKRLSPDNILTELTSALATRCVGLLPKKPVHGDV